MPWQRHVADVAMEVDPDTGLPAYREVVITVPRQAGKSTLLLAVLTHRCITQPRSKVVQTAQTRIDARRKWEEDYVEALQRSRFAPRMKVRLQNGQEAIRWQNGSVWSISSTTEKAAHGQTISLAVIDEAFAQTDPRLEQAFKPAMATKRDAQLWVVSTAGTPSSAYLNSKVIAGRSAVEQGLTRGVAYFEWSADEDTDLDDPTTWWTFHPALGHTITEDVIAADKATMDPAEWRRAYANIPTGGKTIDTVIPWERWEAAADPDSQPIDPVAFALDVTPGRDAAAIAVAGARFDDTPEDRRLHVGLIDHRPGTGWVVPRIAQLVADWQPAAVALQAGSPAASLIPDLEAAGITVRSLSRAEYVAACGSFYDDVVDGDQPRLRHQDQRTLWDAIAGAQRGPAGDAWLWHRRQSTADISPLVAATIARHAFLTAPDPTPETGPVFAW